MDYGRQVDNRSFDCLTRQTWPSPLDAHLKLRGPLGMMRRTWDCALLTRLKFQCGQERRRRRRRRQRKDTKFSASVRICYILYRTALALLATRQSNTNKGLLWVMVNSFSFLPATGKFSVTMGIFLSSLVHLCVSYF